MRLAVGSERQSKLTPARLGTKGFADEVFDCDVESGVSRQPRGLEETSLGAYNRALAALKADSKADAGMGLEAGLVAVGDQLVDMGVVWIIGRSGVSGMGVSRGVRLSAAVVARIEGGQELSEAVAAEYRTNTVEDRDCSAVLTDGVLPVVKFYLEAVELAVVDYRQAALAAAEH